MPTSAVIRSTQRLRAYNYAAAVAEITEIAELRSLRDLVNNNTCDDCGAALYSAERTLCPPCTTWSEGSR